MTFSAWILVVVYLPAVVGIWYIGRENPRANAFLFLPLAITLLYVWIGIYNPPIEQARLAARHVFLGVGSWLDFLVFSYILETRKRRVHE